MMLAVQLRLSLVGLALAAVLFGSAGRLDLPAFWIYWAMLMAFAQVMLLGVLRKDPELMQERFRRA